VIANMRVNHIITIGADKGDRLKQELHKLKSLRTKLEDRTKTDKTQLTDFEADLEEARFTIRKTQEGLDKKTKDLENKEALVKDLEEKLDQQKKTVDMLEDGIKAEMKARIKMQSQMTNAGNAEIEAQAERHREVETRLQHELKAAVEQRDKMARALEDGGIEALASEQNMEIETLEDLNMEQEMEIERLKAKLEDEVSKRKASQTAAENAELLLAKSQPGSPLGSPESPPSVASPNSGQTKKMARRSSVQTELKKKEKAYPSKRTTEQNDDANELKRLQGEFVKATGAERLVLNKKIDAIEAELDKNASSVREQRLAAQQSTPTVRKSPLSTKSPLTSPVSPGGISTKNWDGEGLPPDAAVILAEYFQLYDTDSDGVVHSGDQDFKNLTSSFLFKIKVKMPRKEVVVKVQEFAKQNLPMTVDEFTAWVLTEFGQALPWAKT